MLLAHFTVYLLWLWVKYLTNLKHWNISMHINILSEFTLNSLNIFWQSHDTTYLHRSCRTDKGISRHFPGQWRIPHTTAGNQTSPSSSPCLVALLFPSFRLQGAPQDPAPQRELLVWPLSGSLSPLCSAQSSPWWDRYGPVGSVSHSVLTACNGDELKSLLLSGWASLTLSLVLDSTDWGQCANAECAVTL